MAINTGKKLSGFIRAAACILSILLLLGAWEISSGIITGAIKVTLENKAIIFVGSVKTTIVPLNLVSALKTLFGIYFTYLLLFISVTGCQPKKTIFDYGIRKK